MTKLHDVILSHGGATIKDGALMQYKDGYQVAVNSKEVKFAALHEALNFVETNGLTSIGLWLDGGIWYMDTNSIKIDSKKKAIKAAVDNKQLAVWDWASGKPIYV
jgi:hypothetical protein